MTWLLDVDNTTCFVLCFASYRALSRAHGTIAHCQKEAIYYHLSNGLGELPTEYLPPEIEDFTMQIISCNVCRSP